MLRLTTIGAGAAVGGVLFMGTPSARADEVLLAGDIDVGVPVAQEPLRFLTTGAGFDVRLGYRFRIPYQHVTVVPELAAGYTDLAARVVRLRGGLRLGIGHVFVPYAYAHLGWAHISLDPLGAEAPSTSQASQVGAQGFSFDGGAGLEVAILRQLSVGTHLGYNLVLVGRTEVTSAFPARWVNLGLHASIYL